MGPTGYGVNSFDARAYLECDRSSPDFKVHGLPRSVDRQQVDGHPVLISLEAGKLTSWSMYRCFLLTSPYIY